MTLIELTVFLASCYSIANSFIYGHRDGLNFPMRKLNTTDELFGDEPVSTKWISQPLDHFDNNETTNWNMKFLERLDLWKPGGPVILFINGQVVRADPNYLTIGPIYDLAKETNGALFASEHRYYGESKPFKHYTTENLKYLSSRQALADNARLLKIIKTSHMYSSSKVIVVGGFYAGNLAAWMKLLYPDLVDAAIASSGPVLAKVDFFEYFETVGEDFKKYGTAGCYDNIKKQFRRYEELLRTDEGVKQLKEEENICEENDLKITLNRQLFFLQIIYFKFMWVAEHGNIKKIEQVCNQISNSERFYPSKDNQFGLWNEKRKCIDCDFDRMIKEIKKNDPSLAVNYQSCFEFGHFQTTNSDNQPFTDNIPIDFYYSLCSAIYGKEFSEKVVNEGVIKTNKMYGGLHPNVTNVVFVNGELDPWHRLSVLEDISHDAPAKVIPFVSQSRDFRPDLPDDPKELREAKIFIKHLVKKWIGSENNAPMKF